MRSYSVRGAWWSGIDGVGSVQFLVNRLALLLVSLAIIHFINVSVFWRFRARSEQRQMPPPVAPQMILPPPPPLNTGWTTTRKTALGASSNL